MSALFWYALLAFAGIGIAVFTIYRKGRITELSTWLVFFLFATSLTWLGEFTVLGLFDSYAYRPGLSHDPWAENLAGHLILNSTLWPGCAMAVVTYSLGYGAIALFSVGYVLIEYLFVQSGLYDQHWWKYYMTAVAVLLYLTICKLWFPVMSRNRHGVIRFVTLYFAAFVILHWPFPLLLLAGKQYYNVEFAENLVRSSTIFILLYHLIETFIMMMFLFLDRWYWRLMPYAVSFLGQVILINHNILLMLDEWKLWYTLMIYALTITLCQLMELNTLRPRRKYR